MFSGERKKSACGSCSKRIVSTVVENRDLIRVWVIFETRRISWISFLCRIDHRVLARFFRLGFLLIGSLWYPNCKYCLMYLKPCIIDIIPYSFPKDDSNFNYLYIEQISSKIWKVNYATQRNC